MSGEAVLLPVGGVSSRLDNDSPDYAFSPGLLLTVAGLIIVLLLPGRPGSAWKTEGPLPRRRRHRDT